MAAQAFEAGDFRNIFWRILSFWGLFSDKNFSYKKRKRVVQDWENHFELNKMVFQYIEFTIPIQ